MKMNPARTKCFYALVIFFACILSLASTKAQQTVYAQLLPPSTSSKPIYIQRPVGVTSGTAGVSSSGGATYTIPIALPPGTNGAAPALSLVYNSQAGNGIAGYGWNISGLSTITRSNTQFSFVGWTRPVSLTNEDPFTLDGQRLINIIGYNGEDQSLYETESKNWSQIISYGDVINSLSTFTSAPEWFEVTLKDGSKIEYGNSTDSRIVKTDNTAISWADRVLAWRVNKITDLNGNFVEFLYDDDRIKEILYTKNAAAGLDHYIRVSFSYTHRDEKTTIFQKGTHVYTDALLDKIKVEYIGAGTPQRIREYQLGYGFDNLYSLLQEVTEVGANGETFNSTIFLYGEQTQNAVQVENLMTFPMSDLMTADFDADGRSDLLAAHFYLGNNNVRLHDNIALWGELDQANTLGYKAIYSENITGEQLTYQSLGGGFGTIRYDRNGFFASDFDGDSRDDVVSLRLSTTTSGQTKLTGVDIRYTRGINPATNFHTYSIVNYPNPSFIASQRKDYTYIHAKGNFLFTGDFDGDGAQDMITVLGNYPSSEFRAFFTSPTAGLTNFEITNFGCGPNNLGQFYATTVAEADQVLTIDIDGDGKSELLVIKNQQAYLLTFSRHRLYNPYSMPCTSRHLAYWNVPLTKDSKILVGDFNGDKNSDLLVRDMYGGWHLGISTGGEFFHAPFTFNQFVALNANNPGSDHKVIVADFNGDGKSDIMHGFDEGGVGKLSVYYAKGLEPGSSWLNMSAQFYYEQYALPNTLQATYPLVGDFNGDGRADIINWDAYRTQIIYIRPNSKERLLVRVIDGHNQSTSFTYESLARNQQVYQNVTSLDDPSNAFPYNYITPPLQAVSSISRPDGIGGFNTTSYSYKDAMVYRGGRGFLGFKTMISSDDASEINSEFSQKFNSVYGILIADKTIGRYISPAFQANEVISENQPTISVNPTPGFPSQYWLRTDKNVNIDRVTSTGTEISYQYDNNGNIAFEETKKGGVTGNTVNAVETTEGTFYYGGNYGALYPCKAEKILTNLKRVGSPSVATETWFGYSATGLLTSKIGYSGTPNEVKTSYSHDLVGNVIGVTKSAAGLNHRSTTYQYDQSYRFVTEEMQTGTNVYNKVRTQYDQVLAKPVHTSVNNCQHTDYTYDGFGRLVNTQFDNGTTMSNYLRWQLQNHVIYISVSDYSAGTPDTKVWYDALGREKVVEKEGFGGDWLSKDITYDNKGNKVSETNEYYPSFESPIVTTTQYGKYGRVEEVNNSTTNIIYQYSPANTGSSWIRTITNVGQTSITNIDGAGRIIASEDEGGRLEFTYDSWGNKTSVEHGSEQLLYSIYDPTTGKLVEQKERNSGTTQYTYNAYGELISQTDSRGNVYRFVYDDLGRLVEREGGEGYTRYRYANTGDDCINNKLIAVDFENGIQRRYEYDALGRLRNESSRIDGVWYAKRIGYTSDGKVSDVTYPSQVEVRYEYDNQGNIKGINAGENGNFKNVFKLDKVNGFGLPTEYTLGNNLSTIRTFNQGNPVAFYTQGIQELRFDFDLRNGNLLRRIDNLTGLDDKFDFDPLNRLKQATTNGASGVNVDYDNNGVVSMGNIMSKSDVGDYVYSTTRIHAHRYIDNVTGSIPTQNQRIAYTPFLKTSQIAEGNVDLNITYGPEYSRVKSDLIENGSLVEKKLYLGDLEILEKNGRRYFIHYISSPAGLVSMAVKTDNNPVELFYTYTDHLGSILTITDDQGQIISRQSFDAWGQYRDPFSGQVAGFKPKNPVWLYRGYCGHEHLPQFGLINMNARMYDPMLGKMLGPDNYISDPSSTQAYNRYAYALNNPVSYVDPDGNFPILAVAIGAVIGMYTGGVAANDGQFNPGKWDYQSARTWGYMLGGGVLGGFSGYLGATVASSGMPFANTAAFVSASFFNSVSMNMLTDGRTAVVASFGIGSYNFTTGNFGFIGKSSNSFLEDLSYTFGGLGNLSDIIAGLNGVNVDLISEKKDAISHSAVVNSDANVNVSVGPAGGAYFNKDQSLWKQLLNLFKKVKGELWENHAEDGHGWITHINNVNKNILSKISSNIANGKNIFGGDLKYQGLFNSCVSYTSRALWLVGIPNIGIHPYLLHASILTRQFGLYLSPFLIRR